MTPGHKGLLRPEWQVKEEGGWGARGAGGRTAPPSAPLVRPLLPHFSLFHISRMQIFKASTSERGNQWSWCGGGGGDFKKLILPVWAQTVTPPPLSLSPSCLKLSRSIAELQDGSVHSSVCIVRFKEWGAELCFRWSSNPSQTTPGVPGGDLWWLFAL